MVRTPCYVTSRRKSRAGASATSPGWRLLQLAHAADHVRGGDLLGRRLLGRGDAGGDEQGDERKTQGSRHRLTSGGAVRRNLGASAVAAMGTIDDGASAWPTV